MLHAAGTSGAKPALGFQRSGSCGRSEEKPMKRHVPAGEPYPRHASFLTGRMAVPGKGHERMGQMGRGTGTAGRGRRMAGGQGRVRRERKNARTCRIRASERAGPKRGLSGNALWCCRASSSNSEKSGSNRSCSGLRPPARACSGFYSFLSAEADSEQYGQSLVLLLQF